MQLSIIPKIYETILPNTINFKMIRSFRNCDTKRRLISQNARRSETSPRNICITCLCDVEHVIETQKNYMVGINDMLQLSGQVT